MPAIPPSITRHVFTLLWVVVAPIPPTATAAFPLPDCDAFSRGQLRRALLATVRVDAERASGTGTLVGRRGAAGHLILTAKHVLKGKVVRISSFTEASYPAPAQSFTGTIEVLAVSASADVALLLLTTDRPMPESVPICPPGLEPRGAFDVFSVGCNEPAPTLRHGRTLGTTAVAGLSGTFWKVSMRADPGRSGGALVDGRGFLVGVCYGIDNAGNGIYQGLPEIREVCERAGASSLSSNGPPSDGFDADVFALLAKILVGKALVSFFLRRRV